jgi:pimeloyl-ACP methyl ester carboxylesterase
MATFAAADGTSLAYHETGEGYPLVCLPGGAMRASAYLGNLGGLSAQRRVVRLDLRGTGDSARPADPATYRCDRQVDDVDALRAQIGLERIDLLGHSAGAALAILYATSHPERVGRLVLVTPTPRVVGVEVSDSDRRELVELRRGEPWFPEAYAAFQRIWSGEATEADWEAITPFVYGHWDDTVRADLAREEAEGNEEASMAYYGPGAFDPAAVREAITRLDTPVLLLSGGYDVQLPPKCAARYADLFPHAELATLPRAGHFPWLDDPEWFVSTVAAFLR